MTLVNSLLPAILACVVMGACSGGPGGMNTGGAVGGVANTDSPMVAEDQRFAATEAIAVQGTAFSPHAMGRPPMPGVVVKGRPNLAKQRRKAERRNATAADVQVLVHLLWQAASDAASDTERATVFRIEARDALRKLHTAAAGKATALTVHMLAVAEATLGNDAAAGERFEELRTRFPDSEDRPAIDAWLAWSMLRQGKNRAAAELTSTWTMAKLDATAAYVMAWSNFRAGKFDAARAAIAAAASGWTAKQTFPDVERDLLLILARGGTPAAEASEIISRVASTSSLVAKGAVAKKRYVLMFSLSEAYRLAGRFGLATESLDMLLADPPPGGVPPEDVVGFRFRQADYSFRLNDPEAAAKHAIAALEALPACADKCDAKAQEGVVERIGKLANFFHTVYATSQDPRHFAAASQLYQRYVEIPDRADAAEYREHLKNLENTQRNADRATGKHSDKVMLNLVMTRRESITACYEQALLTEPDLEGALKITFEIGQDGVVLGGMTEPAKGVAGISKVAGCALERVKAWRFSSRTVPGRTVLSVDFALTQPED
jgi:tetratricopeptide (TPR) repeat protein